MVRCCHGWTRTGIVESDEQYQEVVGVLGIFHRFNGRKGPNSGSNDFIPMLVHGEATKICHQKVSRNLILLIIQWKHTTRNSMTSG